MKRVLIGGVCFFLLVTACNKNHPSNQRNPIPVGISAIVNGHKTTFNRNISIDTSSINHTISINAEGDSTAFKSTRLNIIVRGPGPGLVKPGIYTYYSYDLEGSLGISTTIDYSVILFGSYNDTINVLTVTDTTISGLFKGDIEGQIRDFNDPGNPRDSVITVTEGKFNLRW
jgi:hypothetical protein